MSSPKVFINGKYFDKADAKISVYDHGLLYGDGVFEGIRIYNGRAFKLKEHVARLFESARHIKLEIPLNQEQMIKAINDTIAANNKKDGYIRPIVTRGAGSLGLDPRKTSDPQVIVIVDDITLYPPELYESGMEIATVSTIRNHPNAVNPRVKSLNYLNNILAKIEGIMSGCLESLMLNHKGEIAECSGDNIFLVKSGVLRTPPIDAGILEGITRNTVIDLAKRAGIKVEEIALTRHDVFTADECFLTGTAAEIIPVTKCDARVIGTGKPGPITRQLRDVFFKLARTKIVNTHVISQLAWERMVTAVEKVRDRLRRAVQALEEAKVPYAVVGGNAVAAWVGEVDEAAIRNTQDVDILLRRADLDRAKEALAKGGFIYRHAASIDMFLDGPGAKARDAVHIVFAGEKVREEYLLPAPDVDEMKITPTARVLSLDALVRMKLTSFRRKDQVHVLDMIDVGLVDSSWLARLPAELATRLQSLLDDPQG